MGGDGADLSLEGIADEWWVSPPREKSCRYCGERDLVWYSDGEGWRLRDSRGNLHECKEYLNPSKLVCPNNPRHKKFYKYTVVQEVWEVDENDQKVRPGEFREHYLDEDKVASYQQEGWVCGECRLHEYAVDVEPQQL